MITSINTALAEAAIKHITACSIVKPGDIVTTLWTGWKKPQRVRVYHVGAHLVCRYDKVTKDWIAGFAMDYFAERLRANGESKERVPGCGICLNNLTTLDGRVWQAVPIPTAQSSHEESGFNHAGLSWGTNRDNRRAAMLATATPKVAP